MSKDTFYNRFIAIALGVGVLGWTTSASAASPGLAVIQRDAKLNLNTCIDQSFKVMQQRNLDNIKVIGGQVSGSTQNYAVAILCYPIKAPGESVLQSIIVSGPSTEEAEKLLNVLEQAFR